MRSSQDRASTVLLLCSPCRCLQQFRICAFYLFLPRRYSFVAQVSCGRVDQFLWPRGPLSRGVSAIGAARALIMFNTA